MKISRLYLTLLAFVIIFSLGFSGGCSKKNNLLTSPLSAVSEIGIKDYEHDNIITLDINIKKDKDKISEIYKSVEATKVSDHTDDKEGQNSSPKFSLNFKYQDGTQDAILSTETGDFIYRNLSSSGWIGGSNAEIHEVIDKLTEEN